MQEASKGYPKAYFSQDMKTAYLRTTSSSLLRPPPIVLSVDTREYGSDSWSHRLTGPHVRSTYIKFDILRKIHGSVR